MEPDAVEMRVLGCLLEKQRTTPDVYPLSLNALRLACNQSTSRDPVVDYDESTIREALQRLGQRRWTRLASASRTTKYRHLLDETLGLQRDQLAVLCVLMLRGPQTFNELRTRTQRLHDFPSEAELQATIDGLIERELVVFLERQPGQKEQRYQQLLGGEEPGTPSAAPPPAPASAPAPAPVAAAPPAPRSDDDDTAVRLADLEYEVAELRRELAELRAELGA
ncbi:YceH family protein [Svornostia abyssi]|uniref:YceH family protein n=1 Tax=Svornostia abyssi TaxID=2898438 RepID=A0ABY5PK40_9ACTN|nr:YceH family protein [Parviterribacteraceae bacterium J379]